MTNSNQIPAQVEKHLDFIGFWNDGSLFLASSNLTGRYWIGSVWYFQNPDVAPDVEKCTSGSEVEAGIADAALLQENDKRFAIIALDSGAVELLQLKETNGESNSFFLSEAYACEHSDTVSCINMLGEKQAVSGSYDKSIKIWDVQTMTASATYFSAHWDIVTGIACQPDNSDIFASCGKDGRLLTWDTRLPRPATELDNQDFLGIPSAITWHAGQTCQLVVGDESGQILVKDSRNLEKTLQCIKGDNRCIARLKFANHCPQWLATVSDSCTTKVFNMENAELNLIYTDERHCNIVRGLAWSPTTKHLYTCGWDKQVISHKVGTAMETNSFGQY